MGTKYRYIAGDDEVLELLKKCKEDFIKHNPAMRYVPISNRKIIKEVCRVFLKI